MKCSRCQHDNPSVLKFCGECGSKLSPDTAKAKPASPDAYTPKHLAEKTPTSKSAPEGERRQLTVLFCDMVGFTALASRVDPEVLQRIIRTYEDTCAACITRDEGYVFQRLGDGIVAFFGYPLAHEGEAERAIRAGLEIIEALSKLDVADAGHLAVRIGIATGLVVVSSAGKGAVGETMNLASRLQGIAQPGSIVISERVHHLAAGSFDYEDLGEQSLKGITHPIHAYRIVGVSEAASRFEAAHGKAQLTPLVGREQEIGLLVERWALAQDGEGQVLLLSGEPGIGKSRILGALRERLEGQGAQTLRFQCSPYYVNSAFWPSIDNFERALKLGRDELAECKLDKLEALIVAHYGKPLSDVRFIASIMSIPCEERYRALAMTPQKQKDETLRTLVDLTEAAARKQSSVMLFEDLHWADPTTLEMLDLLVDRVKGFPLLLVLTHRPEFQSRWSEHGHVTALNLSKLTRTQSAAIVGKLAGGKSLPAELLEQILTKTDGVPLFVEELTKSILESGELKDAGDRYEYAGNASTISIPATLRDSLMARLDRAMPVKEIAQIGAVIGREFSYELISAVAPCFKTELDNALIQLTDSGLAFRRGTPPDATYTFKHALVQDAAYDSLLRSKRAEHHKRIAEVLEQDFPTITAREPELVAHHYTRAGMPREAIVYWRRAGELALRQNASKEAVANFQQAVAVVAGLEPCAARDHTEAELQSALGFALMPVKGWTSPEVRAALSRVQDLCVNSPEASDMLFRATWGLSAWHLLSGMLRESEALCVDCIAIARRAEPDLLIEATGMWGNALFRQGKLSNAEKVLREGLADYRPEVHHPHVFIFGQDPSVLGHFLLAQTVWARGRPDEAVRIASHALQLARDLKHPFTLAFGLNTPLWIHVLRCEWQHVLNLAGEMIALCDKESFAYWVNWANLAKGIALAELGSVDHGIRLMEQVDANLYKMESREWLTLRHLLLAKGYKNAGRSGEARDRAIQGIQWAKQSGETIYYSDLLKVRGEIALHSDERDVKLALTCFQRAIDVTRAQGAASFEVICAGSLAQLLIKRGEQHQARSLLRPIIQSLSEGLASPAFAPALATLKQLG